MLMGRHVVVWTENGKRRKMIWLLKSTALVFYRELLRQCYFDARYYKTRASRDGKHE